MSETYKHLPGRHTQKKHGQRYTETLVGARKRIAFEVSAEYTAAGVGADGSWDRPKLQDAVRAKVREFRAQRKLIAAPGAGAPPAGGAPASASTPVKAGPAVSKDDVREYDSYDAMPKYDFDGKPGTLRDSKGNALEWGVAYWVTPGNKFIPVADGFDHDSTLGLVKNPEALGIEKGSIKRLQADAQKAADRDGLSSDAKDESMDAMISAMSSGAMRVRTWQAAPGRPSGTYVYTVSFEINAQAIFKRVKRLYERGLLPLGERNTLVTTDGDIVFSEAELADASGIRQVGGAWMLKERSKHYLGMHPQRRHGYRFSGSAHFETLDRIAGTDDEANYMQRLSLYSSGVRDTGLSKRNMGARVWNGLRRQGYSRIRGDGKYNPGQPIVNHRQIDKVLNRAAVLNRRARNVTGYNDDNAGLRAICEAQGFHGLPGRVSKAEFDRRAGSDLFQKQDDVFYRGVTDYNKQYSPRKSRRVEGTQSARQFLEGNLYYGVGVYGNGTYSSNDVMTAKSFSTAGAGGIFRFQVRPGTKIAGNANYDFWKDKEAYYKDYHEKLYSRTEKAGARKRFAAAKYGADSDAYRRADKEYKRLAGMYSVSSRVANDPGSIAALFGYDGFKIDQGGGEQYLVLLNRTAVVAEDGFYTFAQGMDFAWNER